MKINPIGNLVKTKPIQTQYKPKTNPISAQNKPNFSPKQTQFQNVEKLLALEQIAAIITGLE
jgi:hypothetical protein